MHAFKHGSVVGSTKVNDNVIHCTQVDDTFTMHCMIENYNNNDNDNYNSGCDNNE